ncbi:NAP1-related protein 2-like [Octopus sinensis]|uniref:NAP1-related protein 2-like n=1 Tax=Octopus sinensis TaxID=2607531 RepID=A0A6P7U147_9MOLL|nr:NAP1-related protein 2-like [Octopus sinensis]
MLSKTTKVNYNGCSINNTNKDIDIAKCVKELDLLHKQIEDLNSAAADEVINIEMEYAALRRPVYLKRAVLLRNQPNIWLHAVLDIPYEFSPNDYFFDTKLVRIFSFGANNQLISTSIDVSWKQFQTEKSFFDLFTEMRGCNSQDVSMAIKNDIWPSPFKFVRDSAADKF